MSVVQTIYTKMFPVSCTNSYHDVTDLLNHGMVKNTKNWISWEQNITFLGNKKNCNLYLRWHILRSYHFVADVTFKLFQMVLGQLPPRKITPQIIASRTIAPEDNFPPYNCPRGKLLPRKLPDHHKVSPVNNRPHCNKLSSKSTMSELRKTMHCLRLL